jgi:hypothetical protein
MLQEKERIQIASAKPLSMLNTDEKRIRYAQLRRKMGRSRLQVDGDPNIHYFWAGLEDRHEMARLEGLGYTLVREPNAAEILAGNGTPKISANGLQADGTYVVGDVVLMQVDRETYEFIELANSERHDELASGAQRDFRAEAEKLAVPVFDHIK